MTFQMNQRYYKWYPHIVAIYATTLVCANIIAVKLIGIQLPLTSPLDLLVVPAGIVVFPISYIFGDVLTEVYGFSYARQAIWIGFFCNLIGVIAIWLGGILPSAPFWTANQAYQSAIDAQYAYWAILGFTPRLLIASFIAYLVGEFLNSLILAKVKIMTHGRWLWLRTILSTLVGQFADTGIFTIVAFTNLVPSTSLLQAIFAAWLVKSLYEILATPITYWIVNWLKRSEQEDYYDYATSFNPFVPVQRNSKLDR
jgi:queuosine precursor transporter